MVKNTEYITTTHSLAKELLNKPDGFIFATDGEKDYVVESIKRIATHANYDDRVMNWALKLRNCGKGNIKR